MKMRRLISPCSVSTRFPMSLIMWSSRHELCPSRVERAMVRLAEAVLARAGAELVVEALAPEAHLEVQWIAARPDASNGVFHLGRRGLVGVHPRPDFGLVGPARMPHAKRA